MGNGRQDDGPDPAPHPALAQIRAYWEALRREGQVPARADIDPRGIERALAQAFVAERVAPGRVRLRVAGSHLADLAGTDPRGLPLSLFFDPGARDDLAAAITRALEGACPVAVRLSTPRSILQPALRGGLLLLPLRAETGAVDRILGGLAAEGRIGTAPRRFVIDGAATLAEPPRAVAGRGHLRLVHSRG